MDPKDIKKTVVVGAGVMGHSIAQVFAQAGIEVHLVDLNEKALERATNLIKSNLLTLAEYGSISENEIPSILDRIHPSMDLASSARGVDFVVEVVPEVPDVKREIFSQLNVCCSEDTVIASNTSGLDIFDLADVKKPDRLVIAHWFAPAHVIPLVEVVPGPETSKEVVHFTAELMVRLGKEPVIMNEFVPAFIVNQIQNAVAMVVLQMLEKGSASPEDIDRAVKLSLGIRLPVVGVVQTMDFNGLDNVRDILNRLGVKNPLIDEKVSQGHFGAKTSRGIYDYNGRSEAEILKKRDLLYLKMADHLKEIKAFEPV
jgi:3-hydroxybutyryl-CoA dehydrogenase